MRRILKRAITLLYLIKRNTVGKLNLKALWILNKQTWLSSIQRTYVTFCCCVSRNGINQPRGIWRFSFCPSLILILFPFLLFNFLVVERDCDRGGMEDEVRAAPPRRINRDRETRPLSHPPRFLALLSSLSSLIPSGIPSEGTLPPTPHPRFYFSIFSSCVTSTIFRW